MSSWAPHSSRLVRMADTLWGRCFPTSKSSIERLSVYWEIRPPRSSVTPPCMGEWWPGSTTHPHSVWVTPILMDSSGQDPLETIILGLYSALYVAICGSWPYIASDNAHIERGIWRTLDPIWALLGGLQTGSWPVWRSPRIARIGPKSTWDPPQDEDHPIYKTD